MALDIYHVPTPPARIEYCERQGEGLVRCVGNKPIKGEMYDMNQSSYSFMKEKGGETIIENFPATLNTCLSPARRKEDCEGLERIVFEVSSDGKLKSVTEHYILRPGNQYVEKRVTRNDRQFRITHLYDTKRKKLIGKCVKEKCRNKSKLGVCSNTFYQTEKTYALPKKNQVSEKFDSLNFRYEYIKQLLRQHLKK